MGQTLVKVSFLYIILHISKVIQVSGCALWFLALQTNTAANYSYSFDVELYWSIIMFARNIFIDLEYPPPKTLVFQVIFCFLDASLFIIEYFEPLHDVTFEVLLFQTPSAFSSATAQ